MGNCSVWLLPSLEQELEGESVGGAEGGWRSTRWEAAQGKNQMLLINNEEETQKNKKKKVMFSQTTEDTGSTGKHTLNICTAKHGGDIGSFNLTTLY